MAIAFCFLTIGDIKHESSWIHFFESIEDKSRYNIYINSKTPLKSSYFQKYAIENPYTNTKWGTPSLVYATLHLFRAALKNTENKYFVLLSDSCIHVNEFSKVEDFIKTHDTNIFQHVTLNCNKNKDIIFPSNCIFAKASQWNILKRDFIEYCLKKVLVIKSFGPKFQCLDEHFFIMMCINGKYDWKSIDFNYTDWSKKSISPTTFFSMKKDEFKKIQEKYLFMRKVSTDFLII
jgi:Core-2/I-Branching enzyme